MFCFEGQEIQDAVELVVGDCSFAADLGVDLSHEGAHRAVELVLDAVFGPWLDEKYLASILKAIFFHCGPSAK